MLTQGNNAVMRELNRLEEQNTMLMESHLNSKNVIQNFCNENESDCDLIRTFESSNTQIRNRVRAESDKVDRL